MNTPLLRVAAVLIALGAASPQCRAGQDSPGSPPASDEGRWQLEIANGALRSGNKGRATLPNVVDALREIYSDANIVLAPSLSGLDVQDLKLKSASLEDALEAVRVASDNAFRWRRTESGNTIGGIDPTTGMALPVVADDSHALYILEPDPTPKRRNENPGFEVFNLKGYLELLNATNRNESDIQIEKIREIVVDTLRITAESRHASVPPLPSFRFHQGASLLIVLGSPEVLEVSRQILRALPGVAGPPRVVDIGFELGADAPSERLQRRYGLGSAGAGGPSQPGMTPEMRRRYGLPPETAPAAGMAPGSAQPRSPAPKEP